MLFDRDVCAAGLEAFLRPHTPSDLPDPTKQVSGPSMPPDCRLDGRFVLVQQISPGLRCRLGMDIAFGEM